MVGVIVFSGETIVSEKDTCDFKKHPSGSHAVPPISPVRCSHPCGAHLAATPGPGRLPPSVSVGN